MANNLKRTDEQKDLSTAVAVSEIVGNSVLLVNVIFNFDIKLKALKIASETGQTVEIADDKITFC